MKNNLDVILDFDDFSPRNTSFGLLEEMREHYPDLRVTLFTVPWEVRFGTPTPITEYRTLEGGQKERKFKAFIDAVQESDWIEIALHGLTHSLKNPQLGTPGEFELLSYEDAKKRLLVGEKMLLNTGIPYAKLFKAPQWLLSAGAKRAAEDLGWVVCEDHYYNWNLKDNLPDILDLSTHKGFLLGHGHVQMDMGNGIEESLQRIYKLPTNAKFHFLSEYFGAEKVNPRDVDFRDPLEQVEITMKGQRL